MKFKEREKNIGPKYNEMKTETHAHKTTGIERVK